MPDLSALPDPLPAQVLDAVAAGLWPALSVADRRAKAREALGLQPLVPWTDGRMVYVETGAA